MLDKEKINISMLHCRPETGGWQEAINWTSAKAHHHDLIIAYDEATGVVRLYSMGIMLYTTERGPITPADLMAITQDSTTVTRVIDAVTGLLELTATPVVDAADIMAATENSATVTRAINASSGKINFTAVASGISQYTGYLDVGRSGSNIHFVPGTDRVNSLGYLAMVSCVVEVTVGSLAPGIYNIGAIAGINNPSRYPPPIYIPIPVAGYDYKPFRLSVETDNNQTSMLLQTFDTITGPMTFPLAFAYGVNNI